MAAHLLKWNNIGEIGMGQHKDATKPHEAFYVYQNPDRLNCKGETVTRNFIVCLKDQNIRHKTENRGNVRCIYNRTSSSKSISKMLAFSLRPQINTMQLTGSPD